MTSIIWTYAWCSIAFVSFVVRLLVLRHNINDKRLIDSPQANATPLMKQIVNGHLRMSILLATVSVVWATVGLFAILNRLHPALSHSWLATFLGYAFIVTLLGQSAILTILAWFDLRIRGGIRS